MKKLLAPALAILIVNVLCANSAPAQSNAEKDARLAAKVKTAVLQLGTGPTARVSVKLRDGATLEGYLSEAGEDHFTLVAENSGATRDVRYDQVKQVKAKQATQVKRTNLTKGANKVVAIAGAVVVACVVLFFLQRYDR